MHVRMQKARKEGGWGGVGQERREESVMENLHKHH